MHRCNMAPRVGAIFSRTANNASRKIVDIIDVIDGIAFQTNFLPLNAAVAAAARAIKGLIDDSVNQVEAGSTLVDQAGLPCRKS